VSRGEKLLEKMRASKADWSPRELLQVYRWLGFTVTEGSKHTTVQHPDFPVLLANVSRSRVLATGYIETVLELEKELRIAQTANMAGKEQDKLR
jgi:hypothetical protein